MRGPLPRPRFISRQHVPAEPFMPRAADSYLSGPKGERLISPKRIFAMAIGLFSSAAFADLVVLDNGDRLSGSIVSMEDSRKCAELFDQHRHEIDGIVVTLPNFGEERAIANALRRQAHAQAPVIDVDAKRVVRETRRGSLEARRVAGQAV